MAGLVKVLRRTRRLLKGPQPRTGRQLGDERRAAGDWAMAARHYAAHVAAHPDDFGIWVQLGHACKEAGRLGDADVAYQSAADLKPDDADLWLSRGHLAKLRGEPGKAGEYYRRSFAVDANPAAARELEYATAARPGQTPEVYALAGALDDYADGLLTGWIGERGEGVVEVEVLVDGAVIATGVADLARPDVVAAGLARDPVGFVIDVSGLIDLAQPVELHARIKGSATEIAGSPMVAEAPVINRRWADRWRETSADFRATLTARIAAETPEATLSILIPVTEDADALRDLVASLQAQLCDRWEAWLVSTTGAAPKLPAALKKTLEGDARFNLTKVAPTAVLKKAAGRHALILPSDSVLEPEAVWRVVDAISRGAGLVYWDEALIGRSVAGVERFVVRPALSVDHLSAYPDLIGAFSVDREVALAVLKAGVDLDWTDPAAFRTACVVRCGSAAHVPSVLERRRRRSASERRPVRTIATSKAKGRKGDPSGRTLAIIAPDLDLDALRSTVQAILSSEAGGSLDLLVLSRTGRSAAMQRYLDSLGGGATVVTCDAKASMAEAVNAAVTRHGSGHAHLVLIEDKTSPSAGWLGRLLTLLSRPDIGAAAPIAVAANGRIASAGVGVAASGLIHSHLGVTLNTNRGRALGWNRSLVSLREQSAASVCLAVRTADFVEAGGLDPIMSDAMAFADLCLRLGRTGRRTLIDPGVVVRTGPGEGVRPFDGAFRDRWADLIAGGDPFLSPCLDADLELLTLDTMFAPCRIRAIDPPLEPAGAGRWALLGRSTGSVA